MLELGISQVQKNFLELLDKIVIIIDRKSHIKKAVILPYDEYRSLLLKANKEVDLEEGSFSRFIGILDDKYQIEDERYKAIVK
jgi:hypothetical protein